MNFLQVTNWSIRHQLTQNELMTSRRLIVTSYTKLIGTTLRSRYRVMIKMVFISIEIACGKASPESLKLLLKLGSTCVL